MKNVVKRSQDIYLIFPLFTQKVHRVLITMKKGVKKVEEDKLSKILSFLWTAWQIDVKSSEAFKLDVNHDFPKAEGFNLNLTFRKLR